MSLNLSLSPCCRLSEQSRLVAEQKRLVNELRGRYEEAQQWNYKYKVCSQCHYNNIMLHISRLVALTYM